MSLYWKDLAREYPSAKVLLTTRDPVKWYYSVKATIREIDTFMKSWVSLPLRLTTNRGRAFKSAAEFSTWAPTYLGPKYPKGFFGAIDAGEETAVRFYNDWNEMVKNDIPEDRLLVFDVKSGWEPLCTFLDRPVPDEPFPNANDTKQPSLWQERDKL